MDLARVPDTTIPSLRPARPDLPRRCSRCLSEAERLSIQCGRGVLRLAAQAGPGWDPLLADLAGLGILALETLNAGARLGGEGALCTVPAGGGLRLVRGTRLQLGLRPCHWGQLYADTRGPRPGLLAFDHRGRPLHRVHTLEDGQRGALLALAERHAAADQAPFRPGEGATGPCARVTRPSGRAGGRERGRAVSPQAVPTLLEVAREADIRLRVQVGNAAGIQTWRGALERVGRRDDGIEAVAPGQHLWLDLARLDSARVVTRVGRHGPVTHLELRDEADAAIALLRGEPRADGGEDLCWRAVVRALEPLGDHHGRPAGS